MMIGVHRSATAPRSGRSGSIAPHVHQSTEESFYVLHGAFTFTLGVEEVEVGPGSFVLVPRGTRHEMRAASGVDGC